MPENRARRRGKARTESRHRSRRATHARAACPSKRICTGRIVAAVTVSSRSSRSARADQQHRGATEMRERGAAEGVASAQRAYRQVNRCAAARPGASTLACRPVTKSIAWHAPRLALARPELVDAFERDRQRDHRAGRQRHHDVSADRRFVPDLKRRKKRTAALVDQRGSRPLLGRFERVEFGDAAGRGDLKAGVAYGQRRPAERLEIDQRVDVNLRLGEEPRAAGQPCVAGTPTLNFVEPSGRLTSVTVFKFIRCIP